MNRSDLVKAMLKRREEKRLLESVRREIETEAAPPELVSPPRSNIELTEEGIDFLASTTVQPAVAGQEPTAPNTEPTTSAATDRSQDATSMDEDRTPSLGPRRAPSPIANPTGKNALMSGLFGVPCLKHWCNICQLTPKNINNGLVDRNA